MKDINKVVIIGAAAVAGKIGKLFSKAGGKVVLAEGIDYKEVADADMVLECIPGDHEVKKQTLRQCEKQAPPGAILATVASWGVTEIAAATERSEKVVGLNFVFNPFQESCLVQIVKGLGTSEETAEACRSLVEKAGAEAIVIVVKDSPGLVLDRVIAAVVNEAAIMYATEVASIEDIDRITKLCLNWPMGPFEFADTIGLDNVLATLEVLAQQEGTRFLPCRLLREMVAMQRLGKKTGRGFYTYS